MQRNTDKEYISREIKKRITANSKVSKTTHAKNDYENFQTTRTSKIP